MLYLRYILKTGEQENAFLKIRMSVKTGTTPEPGPTGKTAIPNQEDKMDKISATMYGTVTGSGDYDMTRDDLLSQVRESPVFSDPDDVAAEDTDGVRYTGRDLCEMAGVDIHLE